MNVGLRLRQIAEHTSAIEGAVDEVIMCHDWLHEKPPRRPRGELRAQLAEAIERLKAVRHV